MDTILYGFLLETNIRRIVPTLFTINLYTRKKKLVRSTARSVIEVFRVVHI